MKQNYISKLLLVALILSINTSLYSDERIFTLKGNVHKLVNKLTEQPNQDIPDIIKDADLSITAKLMPKQGYYKVDVTLLEPYSHVVDLYKSIELWEQGDKIVVKTTVDVSLKRSKFPFRWFNIVKRLILPKIKQEILNKEQELLEGITNE